MRWRGWSRYNNRCVVETATLSKVKGGVKVKGKVVDNANEKVSGLATVADEMRVAVSGKVSWATIGKVGDCALAGVVRLKVSHITRNKLSQNKPNLGKGMSMCLSRSEI